MHIVNIKWYAESEEELAKLPSKIILPDWIDGDYSEIDRYLSDIEDTPIGGYTLVK